MTLKQPKKNKHLLYNFNINGTMKKFKAKLTIKLKIFQSFFQGKCKTETKLCRQKNNFYI